VENSVGRRWMIFGTFGEVKNGECSWAMGRQLVKSNKDPEKDGIHAPGVIADWNLIMCGHLADFYSEAVS
jgi:hypothetical protein